jgi:hypothetical protein
MAENNDKIIRDAQYRKGASIAFFNATNNATQIVELLYKSHPQDSDEAVKKDISKWRDWLLEEHKTYYSEVIANIGKNYDSKATIEKLKTAKNIDELKGLWISLSEDERRDGDVIKEVNLLKKSYEKN